MALFDLIKNFEELFMKKFIYCCLIAGLLSACATDPYTGEKKISKTTIGTGIGTVAGAGIGAMVGGKKGALIGAGVGAVGGLGTGAYMDTQAKKLRQELVNTGVQVVKTKEKIVLIMPGNITFDTGKATIQNGFEPVLNAVAKVIKEYDNTMVSVTGYTDSMGSATTNSTLSLRRANAVSNYLRLQGVSSDRLITDGMGEENPIASNNTAGGRAQNRRVEITLINKKS